MLILNQLYVGVIIDLPMSGFEASMDIGDLCVFAPHDSMNGSIRVYLYEGELEANDYWWMWPKHVEKLGTLDPDAHQYQ
jgi:hypothetical protein